MRDETRGLKERLGAPPGLFGGTARIVLGEAKLNGFLVALGETSTRRRLLLEAMQHIDDVFKVRRIDRPIGVSVIVFQHLDQRGPIAGQGFGVFIGQSVLGQSKRKSGRVKALEDHQICNFGPRVRS